MPTSWNERIGWLFLWEIERSAGLFLIKTLFPSFCFLLAAILLNNNGRSQNNMFSKSIWLISTKVNQVKLNKIYLYLERKKMLSSEKRDIWIFVLARYGFIFYDTRCVKYIFRADTVIY